MIKKIKVLFLSRRFTPHIGGVETHLKYLSAQLSKQNFNITVITEQDNSEELLTQQIGAVSVLRIPLPYQQTSKVAIWRWLLNHLYEFTSAEVIHIHDVFFWILPIYPWLKLNRKKIYMTFHGYEGNQNPNFRQKFWHQLAAKLSDGNICIGRFHQKWYGVKPSLISFGAVENIMPKTHFKEAPTRITRIIFVGRLSEDTGILVYLSAVQILVESSTISLDVFGDGPQLGVARQFVAKHKLPVRFHGFVPQESIRQSSYDIAFVSQYLAILECLAAGLPIISYYNIEMKKDYLLLSYFSRWLVAAKSAMEIVSGYQQLERTNSTQKIKIAQVWALQQTWQKLARKYTKLWGY